MIIIIFKTRENKNTWVLASIGRARDSHKECLHGILMAVSRISKLMVIEPLLYRLGIVGDFQSMRYSYCSRSVMSDSLCPHGLQHARLICPPSPGVCSNSCPLNQ